MQLYGKNVSKMFFTYNTVGTRILRPCRCTCLLSSLPSAVLPGRDRHLEQTPQGPWLSAALSTQRTHRITSVVKLAKKQTHNICSSAQCLNAPLQQS